MPQTFISPLPLLLILTPALLLLLLLWQLLLLLLLWRLLLLLLLLLAGLCLNRLGIRLLLSIWT